MITELFSKIKHSICGRDCSALPIEVSTLLQPWGQTPAQESRCYLLFSVAADSVVTGIARYQDYFCLSSAGFSENGDVGSVDEGPHIKGVVIFPACFTLRTIMYLSRMKRDLLTQLILFVLLLNGRRLQAFKHDLCEPISQQTSGDIAAAATSTDIRQVHR